MYYIPFMKWQHMRLSDICKESAEHQTDGASYINFLNFCGPSRIYASFHIDRMDLPKGKNLMAILVAHEGDWTTEEGMYCHDHYKYYENVQSDLGKGLVFRRKGFSAINSKSLFLFEIDKTCNEHILAVPATGEEIYFEIYGIDKSGDLVLLVDREL